MVEVCGVFGPSKASKSTFINLFCGDVCVVGKDDGESETIEVNIYQNKHDQFKNTSFLDTPGIRDSRLIPDDVILDKIRTKLLSLLKENIDGIIILESVRSEIISLRNTLVKIEKLFGNCNSSILVLLSKFDDETSCSQEKKQNLFKICKENNLKYLPWSNFTAGKENFDQLKELIDSVKSYTLANMDSFIKDVHAIASKLQKENIENKVIEKAVEYVADETYEVPVQKTRPKVIPTYREDQIEEQAKKRQSETTTPYQVTLYRTKINTVNLNQDEIRSQAVLLRQQEGEYMEVKEDYEEVVYVPVTYEEKVFDYSKPKLYTFHGRFNGAEYLKIHGDVARNYTYGNSPKQHYIDWGHREDRLIPVTSDNGITKIGRWDENGYLGYHSDVARNRKYGRNGFGHYRDWGAGENRMLAVFVEETETFYKTVKNVKVEQKVDKKTRYVNKLKPLDPYLKIASQLTKQITEQVPYVETRYQVPPIEGCRQHVRSLQSVISEPYTENEIRVKKVTKTKKVSFVEEIIPKLELFFPEAIKQVELRIMSKYKI